MIFLKINLPNLPKFVQLKQFKDLGFLERVSLWEPVGERSSER